MCGDMDKNCCYYSFVMADSVRQLNSLILFYNLRVHYNYIELVNDEIIDIFSKMSNNMKFKEFQLEIKHI